MSNFSVEEVLKNVDVDEEMRKDLLMRQAKLIYPEAENWVLTLAIEAYVNELKKEEKEMPEIN